MSAPSRTCLPGNPLDLPDLPRDHEGPVFAEPWQAQAFALAVNLSQQGHFTWTEWASTLGDELSAAAARGEPDDGSRYYEHWLRALERLTASKGLTDLVALDARKAAWIDAYRQTPHGRPVELQPHGSVRSWWLGAGGVFTVAAFWALHSGHGEIASESTITAAAHLGMTPAGPGTMTSLATSAGLGAVLGMRHALEPDHLAAVSTLMTGDRTSAKAALLGACWGLGHTATLLATGIVLAVLQAEMPERASGVFELAVVAALIGFGLRAIVLGSGHAHGPTHRHGTHSEAATARWTFGRPLVVGAVHGLAGSGALLAVVAATLPTAEAQLTYLLLIGGGSILGMAILSGVVGWPLARLGANHLVVRVFSLIVGGISVALGLSLGVTAVARLI